MMRLDKWLWAMRLCKTRALAADACRLGRVKMAGQPVKASREVRLGDTFEVEQTDLTRIVRAKAFSRQRLSAKLVPEFMEDLTPTEEWERARKLQEERRLAPPPVFAHGLRPTKQQRRELEKFLGSEGQGEA